MWKREAVDFFRSQKAVAVALGITEQAISAWPEVVPRGRAFELQALTNGRLKVNTALYQKHSH